MSLFPIYVAENIENVVERTTIPVEYEIDWSEKRLTGRTVDGADAIKIWIQLALKTPRYRHMIYTWDYGSELETLIGQNHSMEYLETETKRMVMECLSVHGQVGQIRDFTVKWEHDLLGISFTVDTPYGPVDIREGGRYV